MVSKPLSLLVLGPVSLKRFHNSLAWDCLVNKLKRVHNWKSRLPREGLTQLKFENIHQMLTLSVCSISKSPARADSQQRRGSDYSTAGFEKNKFQRVYCAECTAVPHTQKHLMWTIMRLQCSKKCWSFKRGSFDLLGVAVYCAAEDVFRTFFNLKSQHIIALKV